MASLTARFRPRLARLRSIVDRDGAGRDLARGVRVEDLLNGLEREGLPHAVLDLGSGTAQSPGHLTLLVADEAIAFIDAFRLPMATGAAVKV